MEKGKYTRKRQRGKVRGLRRVEEDEEEKEDKGIEE